MGEEGGRRRRGGFIKFGFFSNLSSTTSGLIKTQFINSFRLIAGQEIFFSQIYFSEINLCLTRNLEIDVHQKKIYLDRPRY